MADFERSPRVLVVEDDGDIADVLQRSLRLEGYDVRIACDGQLALDEANAFLPDLVILDLGLPKIDGIEVARELRRDDNVPILMLTARDALEARVTGLDAGADDYLVKPFEFAELLARLRALQRRPAVSLEPLLVVGEQLMHPLVGAVLDRAVGRQQLRVRHGEHEPQRVQVIAQRGPAQMVRGVGHERTLAIVSKGSSLPIGLASWDFVVQRVRSARTGQCPCYKDRPDAGTGTAVSR